MFLTWISQLVRAAVIRGFQQAVEDLNLEPDHDQDALEAFKGRLTFPAVSNGDTKIARKAK